MVLEEEVRTVGSNCGCGSGHGRRWNRSGWWQNGNASGARLDKDVGGNYSRAGTDGTQNRAEKFAMRLSCGRVGQLLPKVVLRNFTAGHAMQQGLCFRTLEDFGLTGIVNCRRVVHLVEMQHLLEEFVLLLLVMQHVNRMRRMSCWGWLGIVRLLVF